MLLLLFVAATADIIEDVRLDTVTSGFDKETCWVHARAGAIPGDPPIVVMTMQRLLLSGSDVFYALHEVRTDDGGGSWQGPTEIPGFRRVQEEGGIEAVVCDFTPKWHAASRTLLGTGHIARYKDNKLVRVHRRGIPYAPYDPATKTWAPWKTVALPDDPDLFNAGAGSTQRVDLDNGDILLPVYHKGAEDPHYATSVFRCAFDGTTLSFIERGTSLSVPIQRGFCEPSLARFDGRFFLTLRNDEAGYVSSGSDGLHFDAAKPWTFDDGADLGNYNTQQHWVTDPHGRALFLVYTRRGANNDHVFRHRAPLFIAQVDPERLCVLRSTERILVPERGARLGNFAVTEVSGRETRVTVTEWMQPAGCEKYGSDNSVYAARIVWRQP